MSERSRPHAALVTALGAAAVLPAGPAEAAGLGAHETAALSLFFGAIIVAVGTSVALLRTRRRLSDVTDSYTQRLLDANVRLDRAEAELAAEDRVIVTWAAGQSEPQIVGDPGRVPGLPSGRRLLAFGAWLEPQLTQALEQRLAALRDRGQPFRPFVPETGEGWKAW